MTVFDHLRQRLLQRAGLIELPPPPFQPSDFTKLRCSEWSSEFETFMRNRLIMGALRYGRIGIPNKPQYDRISSMEKRLKAYCETGNKELLVDVANLCLLEFVECHHPKAHFSSLDEHDFRAKKI